MNYLTELLAFYKWLETARLSPLLQAYWHLLMYYNNKAAVLGKDNIWYWPVRFNVPNTTLMAALGLKNRQALWTKRQTLIKTERITYTPDTGCRAGQYTLVPFDRGLAVISVESENRPGPTQVWTQSVTGAGYKAQPYINTVNNKQASIYYSNPDSGASLMGFNLLPKLTESEEAAVRALYPDNEVACFNALWDARERKKARG